MLKEAMDKAKEDAEREKHQRRMEHLWKGGHDVQRLHANFEGMYEIIVYQAATRWHRRTRALVQGQCV